MIVCHEIPGLPGLQGRPGLASALALAPPFRLSLGLVRGARLDGPYDQRLRPPMST
ncbi:MAG: hypothetical protein IPO88_00555 [Nannocystis sp.]|uniref:hypothetical protein n=1 Tax=Nannocystis sp. TaxID=1962667 RepID=UPI0024238A4E|nr:hypothetical protein [Nannocystis sp.]MBK9751994.1 hypothetical protein [Nannocystis sp.]